MIRVERCLEGRLRNAYPAARHDVELQVDGEVHDLTHLLRRESDRILGADPLCRKVVFAVPAGDPDMVLAAEVAGFRYVVEVDIPDPAGGVLTLVLLVREPAHVTAVDMDLDRVPHT